MIPLEIFGANSVRNVPVFVHHDLDCVFHGLGGDMEGGIMN